MCRVAIQCPASLNICSLLALSDCLAMILFRKEETRNERERTPLGVGGFWVLFVLLNLSEDSVHHPVHGSSADAVGMTDGFVILTNYSCYTSSEVLYSADRY